MVKISSIYVAFLENMNFNSATNCQKINMYVHENLDFFTLTIFTGWIPYVTPWYAEMVEYCLKNDESVLLKPHPTDLSKFIMCNNYGILFEMHCPTGTLFDVRLKICNHNYKITNEIRDSMAPKWLTKPKKPTKTTRKTKTTTVKSIDDYDTVSNCSDFAFDGFR